MEPSRKLAVFIDFDEIRDSFLASAELEPVPADLLAHAQSFHLPLGVLNVYGNFSRHPAVFERAFDTLGIRRVQVDDNPIVALSLDAYDLVNDDPGVTDVLLMSGDSAYLRVVARLRNRYAKRVYVVGVAGMIDESLVGAADITDALDPSVKPIQDPSTVQDALALLALILWCGHKWTPPPTYGSIVRYVAGERQPLGDIRESEVKALLNAMLKHDILRQEEATSGSATVTALTVNILHPLVQRAKAYAVAKRAGTARRDIHFRW